MTAGENNLPSFPVDDATLLAVEHALGGSYALDEEDNHVLVGADYTFDQLLDFMSGATGDDPDAEILDRDWDGTPRVIYDTRVHYHVHDVVSALIAEVRRLRQDDE